MSDRKVLEMHNEFNKSEEYVYIKSYMFIKGYAMAKNLKQTLIALAYARRLHDGQYRKDGTPYIVHPLKVCTTLINYGVEDDIVLAASLLHDVVEDCIEKLPMGGKELVVEYGLSQEVLDIIHVLTKEPGLDQYELSVYFKNIRDNPRALLIKLSDRLHNSSTLYTFSIEKMRKYVDETKNFILPIASWGKLYYPEYSNVYSILKSGIYSLNHSMEIMLEKFKEHDTELTKKIAELEEKLKEKEQQQ